MPYALLVIIQPGQATREFEVADELVAIGRALDNTICLDGDTNVSRYHAEIEKRGDNFWLLDLGSSNGTTVNDAPVEFERQLQHGDLISVGGSTVIEFHLSDRSWAWKEESQREAPEAPAEAARPEVMSATAMPATTGGAAKDAASLVQQPLASSQSPAGPSVMLVVAGIGGGLLLTGLVSILFWRRTHPECNPIVSIVSPQTGATIRGRTPIRVEVQDPTKCIDRVIYQLDGQKIASSEFAPYESVLDPENLPDLNSGTHLLSVTVEDEDGNKKLQAEELRLAFDLGNRTATPATSASPTSISIDDVKNMTAKLAKRINGKSDYIFDREFLQQVQARTSDYLSGGYFDRARVFRDPINDSFVGKQGLEAPLGYVMAMSRSRFTLTKERTTYSSVTSVVSPEEPQGLWQIQPSLAQSTGYIGPCGTAKLADADQNCSAIVASMYMKVLDVDLFSGDFIYAIACFGMQPKEAAQFRDQLPPDRRDFWKVIRLAEQRDGVVRFFAAGIVGENPQEFGLLQDKPLSSLYPQK